MSKPVASAEIRKERAGFPFIPWAFQSDYAPCRSLGHPKTIVGSDGCAPTRKTCRRECTVILFDLLSFRKPLRSQAEPRVLGQRNRQNTSFCGFDALAFFRLILNLARRAGSAGRLFFRRGRPVRLGDEALPQRKRSSKTPSHQGPRRFSILVTSIVL